MVTGVRRTSVSHIDRLESTELEFDLSRLEPLAEVSDSLVGDLHVVYGLALVFFVLVSWSLLLCVGGRTAVEPSTTAATATVTFASGTATATLRGAFFCGTIFVEEVSGLLAAFFFEVSGLVAVVAVAVGVVDLACVFAGRQR